MKIIIVGCGKVGATLAVQLCRDGHDVTVLDRNPLAIRSVSSVYDVLGMEGDGSSYSTLKDAGIESADLLIAVTDSDEKNLLCCLIGQKAGNVKTVARIRDPIYNSEISFFQKNFGLSMVINPELSAAQEMGRIFRFPSAISIDTFSKGRVELLTFVLSKTSVLVGKPLTYIHSKLKSDVLVAVVRRGNTVTIPSGNFVLEAEDTVSVIIGKGLANEFFKKIDVKANPIQNVMIGGGGRVGVYLARRLIAEGIGVKIIERDHARCEELSELLPRAQIIHGDAADEELLLEEGIQEVDGFASMTDIDEQNIMMSLFAKQNSNVKAKLVTKITHIGFDDVIESLDLGSIINPKDTTAAYILQFVRSMEASEGSNMENLYRLAGDEVEAMEFHIKEKCRATGVPLLKLNLKKNTLIGKIYRGGKLFTPTGQDTMEVGDHVILVTLAKNKFQDLDDILEA
ncbi:MAG: Trk system potassium transporter TrkA [Lachnospiraceae bacterium]|nr:Trk system potassium transporter TrkA [Lachnospiraceae bacterium]